MKVLGLFVKIAICLALCAGLASADSLQLRNGRRLQGKYIGGTSTAIGFMSGASVEYFPTSDVLVLMFDNATESSWEGTQRPSPMSGGVSPTQLQLTPAYRTDISSPVTHTMVLKGRQCVSRAVGSSRLAQTRDDI
jgi:hypothetical protein